MRKTTLLLPAALLVILLSAAAPDPREAKLLEESRYFLSLPEGERTAAAERIYAYYQAGSTEARLGVEAAAQYALFAKRKDAARENQALELLAMLLERLGAAPASPAATTTPAAPAVPPADPMIAAIALVNSWPWSIADGETRAAILDDCAAQYALYLDIADWQAREKLAYRIEGYPLAAKVLWADRLGTSYWPLAEAMRARGGEKLGLELYREFYDRPEKLAELRDLVRAEGLASESITETCRALEDFVHGKRAYRSSMENLEDFAARGGFSAEDLEAARAEKAAGGYYRTYLGKERRWDEFSWFNYQWGLFREAGRFEGDCGTTTAVQMAFYRACGIAPISLQYINPDGVAAYTHNFPGYWHPAMQRILAVQKPVFRAVGGKALETAVPEWLHYTKPAWHAWKFPAEYRSLKTGGAKEAADYAYYPGDSGDQLRIASLLSIGWERAAFEASLWGDAGLSKGSFFSEARSPRKLVDSDGDGLPDPLEKQLGTSPAKVDSDGDGKADAWEIERGYDPLRKGDVPAGIVAVDGLADPAEYGVGKDSAGYIPDPKGDCESDSYVYDVAWFLASASGDKLRLAAGYHGPIAANAVKLHSIMVVERGGGGRRLWFQWVGRDYCQAYLVGDDDSYAKLGNAGLRAEWARDAEFSVPLSWFPGARGLWVRYYGCGHSKGADQVADDCSEFVAVALDARDELIALPAALARAEEKVDPKGDPKGLLSSASPDIAGIALARYAGPEGPALALRVRFWNDAASLPFGLRSLIVEGGPDANLTVQWWDPTAGGAWKWDHAGKSVKLAVSWKGFFCTTAGKVAYLSIPTSLLEENGIAPGATIHYDSGGAGKKKGSWATGDDVTDKLPLP